MMGLRVGQGYDVHRLVVGRPLTIGGVTIPHTKGLLGHSDADVLLHAVIDAVLGAAALGDIGRHFPDTDPHLCGVDSRVLLRQVVAKVRASGWEVVNVDATVIAQKPRLAPYVEVMCALIAEDLGIEAMAVNVKGKSNETLGYLGREEAIEAQAVCLICRSL